MQKKKKQQAVSEIEEQGISNEMQQMFEKHQFMKAGMEKTIVGIIATAKVEVGSVIVGSKKITIRMVMVQPDATENGITNIMKQYTDDIKKVILSCFFFVCFFFRSSKPFEQNNMSEL